MGKKSKPKQPAAPDPKATADAQAAANTKAASDQAALNRINQYGPDGSVTYNIDGYDANGIPKYSQHTTLSPQQQALYDQQNKIAQSLGNTATGALDRANQAMSTNISYDGMTPLQTNVQSGPIQTSLDYSKLGALPTGDSFNESAQKASDSAYAALAARLDPQFAQRESAQDAKLAAMGITNNSQAHRREVDNLSRDRNDAYGMASLNAFGAGLAAQNQGYNQALSTRQQGVNEVNMQGTFANGAQQQGFDQGVTNANLNNQGRQQQIAEATQQRNQPLQDIAMLLGTGGGYSSPEFADYAQSGVAAPDYQGAVYANYNAANQQYQSQLASRASMLGSVFGSMGTAAGMVAMSDRRLKENVKRIGTLANGLATYVYNYIGDTAVKFGVMAQEALKVIPDAVVTLPNGYMAVDYRKVYA